MAATRRLPSFYWLKAPTCARATRRAGTALLLASMSDYAQTELVQLLLAKGAEANATDNLGNTALMLATQAGAFQVVESLLTGGTNVNAKNKEGWTALRYARESKEANESSREEMIKLLTKAGANEK